MTVGGFSGLSFEDQMLELERQAREAAERSAASRTPRLAEVLAGPLALTPVPRSRPPAPWPGGLEVAAAALESGRGPGPRRRLSEVLAGTPPTAVPPRQARPLAPAPRPGGLEIAAAVIEGDGELRARNAARRSS